jgi:microcystin-dependent protein
MSEPFLGEIKIIAWNYPAKGWAFCNGQLLPINQNQPLFALLGTMYGGNGQTNFALPDFRGKAPMHVGQGHTQGETAGSSAVTITLQTMPQHIHFLNASANAATSPDPHIPAAGTYILGQSPTEIYAQPSALVPMNDEMVSLVGGSQPHENRQPLLVLNFMIALQGIFPSQN